MSLLPIPLFRYSVILFKSSLLTCNSFQIPDLSLYSLPLFSLFILSLYSFFDEIIIIYITRSLHNGSGSIVRILYVY